MESTVLAREQDIIVPVGEVVDAADHDAASDRPVDDRSVVRAITLRPPVRRNR